MRFFFICLFFLPPIAKIFGQKALIDTSIYGKWPSIGPVAISNDGKYSLYNIKISKGSTLVIESTDAKWKIQIQEVDPFKAVFFHNSRLAACLNRNDSLCLITLGDSATFIPNVRSFKTPSSGMGEWIAYQLNDPSRELILRNLLTGVQRMFPGTTDYMFNENGNAFVFQQKLTANSTQTGQLQWFDLSDNSLITIWHGLTAGNFVFDAQGAQMIFSVDEKRNSEMGKSFWYYKRGSDTVSLLADVLTPGIDSALQLDRIQSFSKDGTRIFISLREKSVTKPMPDAVPVSIWSYKDAKLQSEQLNERFLLKSYIAVVNIQEKKVVRLQQENERGWPSAGEMGRAKDVVLIEKQESDVNVGEDHWNPASQHYWYIVSTVDGKRYPIEFLSFSNINSIQLSPQSKYVVFYNFTQRNYFSYEISSGIVRNITKYAVTNWSGSYKIDLRNESRRPKGIACWLEGDLSVLIYDQNDIWMIDPMGIRPPINITNGYGRKRNIVFDLGIINKIPTVNDRLLLYAFNTLNKENGFYSKELSKRGDPSLLSMGSFIYYIPHHGEDYNGLAPVRSAEAETYIVRRESATEFPNLFSTSDFKHFTRLTDLFPERNYNWLTTELLTWKLFDGSSSQGILYKPENFDPKKRYPIIFYYYEKLSDGLNGYIRPALATGSLNISTFVSNGYLVFTPDLHFKIGEPGQSALNTILSAVKLLSKMPFVDTKKMGIQGMSFGGYTTNYLVTHTNIFAAACSSSGLFDLVSFYGGLTDNGTSLQVNPEWGQNRIGGTLWERTDLYIKNSPIFTADHVTTPFLMMHTKNDAICPFSNAVEFFTALRRLGKRAWMLEYDEGIHAVQGKSALDFTIRMQQFFDHFLKGYPAPKWMTEGIPARLRGIESGLDLPGPKTK